MAKDFHVTRREKDRITHHIRVAPSGPTPFIPMKGQKIEFLGSIWEVKYSNPHLGELRIVRIGDAKPSMAPIQEDTK